MRKKERQFVTIGLVLLFAAIGWWAYHGGGGGFIDLSNHLNGNNSSTTYQLAVADLAATVDQATGHVQVSFSLTNEEHFNISSVQVLYALNVADPNNASYTGLNATEQNGTYKAEIPASFGDVVYYKVKVTYAGGELVTDVQSITVSDTTAPTLTSVSLNYNSTAGVFDLTFNATDNDQIAEYIVHYAENRANNFTNVTFSVVNATTTPITISNVTEGNYYAFWFEVKDLSGNVATLFNETNPFVLQANASSSWPVEVNATG